MYMMMIEKSKTYNKMTKQVVMEHVENIRRLSRYGRYVYPKNREP